MTMHRSWIVWLISTVTFFVSVAAIIATGANQNSNSIHQAVKLETDSVELPQISDYAQDYRDYQSSDTSVLESGNAQSQSAQSQSVQSQSAQSQPHSPEAVKSTNSQPAEQRSAAQSPRSGGRAALAKPAVAAQLQAQAVVGVSYQPKEVVKLAHPTNYGERYARDVNGNLVDNEYIVVLHETVGSASSALNTFQTNHPRDEDQVSYHTLIGLDGTIYYVVPPEQRAFGAGDSAFQSFVGEEAVFTNAAFPSSVNNFAYHISLETPLDGQNNNATSHSGYTEAQYQSLAWLLARTNISDDRITTHRNVDRSGSRMDPRSFEADRMFRLLRQYPSRQQAG